MERPDTVPHTRHRNDPDYAKEVMDGARPVSSQLTVAAAILATLLVAMSAIETSM
jgi:hypothetical protein